jgi:hypothetical protein
VQPLRKRHNEPSLGLQVYPVREDAALPSGVNQDPLGTQGPVGRPVSIEFAGRVAQLEIGWKRQGQLQQSNIQERDADFERVGHRNRVYVAKQLAARVPSQAQGADALHAIAFRELVMRGQIGVHRAPTFRVAAKILRDDLCRARGTVD